MHRKFRLGFAIVRVWSGVVAIIFRLCSEKNGVTISSPEVFDIIIIMWAVTGLSEIEATSFCFGNMRSGRVFEFVL